MVTQLLQSPDAQTLLARTQNYQKALVRILNKIRNSVNQQALWQTTAQDIARLLNVERVACYRFNADWSGQFINELGFAQSPWDQMEAFGRYQVWEDSHLQETKGGRYRRHDPFAVADIYAAGHARCHIEMLEQFQIRAYAIAPIFVADRLWGLLAVYQHSEPRNWADDEVDFLTHAADHLGIAMQHNVQKQVTEEKNVALQAAVAKQRALVEVVGKIRSSLNTQSVLTTACQELCQLLSIERAAVYRFDVDWSGQFVCEYGVMPLVSPFGKDQVWQDSHLQETKGGRYRNNETFAVDDIYQAGHARCHLDMLEQFKIRAYAIAPIFVGQRLWGLMGAYQHSRSHAWKPVETDFLSQVAGQIGVAIQQGELLNHSKQQSIALEKSISRQRALTEVVSKVRSSLDINLILETTCQEVTTLLEVDRAAVYRFNADWSGEFVSHFSRLGIDQDSQTPFGQNPVWQDTHLQETQGGRYRNNETLAVSDIYEAGYSRCHLDLLEQYKVRAYALVPIFVGRTLWGLLAVYQNEQPYGWDSIEVDFLSQVANQLGVAIQSANTLKESQIRAEDLHQAAKQRQILFDVVAKIRESLDLETIFRTTAQEVRQSLKADRVGIFQFVEGTNYCKGKFIAEDVLPDFGCAVGTVVEDHCFGENYAAQYAQGRIQVIADIHAVSFEACHVEFLSQFQIKSQVIIPLMKGRQLWGLLCLHQCDRARSWSDSTVDFAKQVAAQLSVALKQAELLAQTQQQASQLTQTVEELQSAQLQIIQSEKMASLGQLVAGVAHEINNPISFIHGNLTHADEYIQELLHLVDGYQEAYPTPANLVADLLEKTDVAFIQSDLPKLLQSMKVGTERIREIVSSLRNFSRLDESDVKSVNIHDGIDSTLMILQNRLKPIPHQPGIQIVKDYNELPMVECYPGQLNQVFMNLLANAIDALEARNQDETLETLQANPSQIRITTLRTSENGIAIHVSDNGPGMPPEVVAHVFDPFFTMKPIGTGTGLGLSISYQIITEKHLGKLYCYSTVGQGTEFVVEIPVKQRQQSLAEA